MSELSRKGAGGKLEPILTYQRFNSVKDYCCGYRYIDSVPTSSLAANTTVTKSISLRAFGSYEVSVAAHDIKWFSGYHDITSPNQRPTSFFVTSDTPAEITILNPTTAVEEFFIRASLDNSGAYWKVAFEITNLLSVSKTIYSDFHVSVWGGVYIG